MSKRLKYNRVTIQQQERFTEIKEYREYLKEKEKIQKRYPSKPWDIIVHQGPSTVKDDYTDEWLNDWQEYKKEITDLILQPDGNFQKFLWKLTPDKENLVVERFLSSAKQGKKRLQDK